MILIHILNTLCVVRIRGDNTILSKQPGFRCSNTSLIRPHQSCATFTLQQEYFHSLKNKAADTMSSQDLTPELWYLIFQAVRAHAQLRSIPLRCSLQTLVSNE